MGHSGDINQTTTNGQKRNPFHHNHITQITDNQKVCISRLVNSVYFYIGTCFIMNMPEEYRLIAIHKKTILFDKNYRTLRGARIAFRKQFKNLAWNDDVVAEWSHFYQPDRDWIDKMLSITENAECN
jgi:hypothetical protein